MAEQIKDGSGTASLARVDSNRRLHTQTVSIDEQGQANKKGNAYNLNTSLVTLTSAAESGVMYVKNNESRDLHVIAIIVILGPSTGGSATDTTRVRFYKNPTTGTLISNATDADINSNRNFKSGNTLNADVFKGATGNSITDGNVHIESLVSPGNRVSFGIDEILSTGNSIAVSYEPPDDNTSMKTMTAVVCHLIEEANRDPNG